MKFDFHYLGSVKYTQWLGIVLILLFSLLIIKEWFALNWSPVPVQPVMGKETVLSQTVKQDAFDSILKTSLFGTYISHDLSEQSVKKSLLNVSVSGILLADKIEDSQVIIRASNGEEKTYKTGDTIPGNAVIKRITAGGVLVERNGSLESLSLPKNELRFEPAAKPLKEE